MSLLAQEEALSDVQSLREMIWWLVDRRPASSKRQRPRFPAPAVLVNRIKEIDPDCLILVEVEDGAKEFEEGEAGEISINGYVVDFSETGLQLQFPFEDIPSLLKGRMRFIEVRGVRVPVLLKWCKHSPQAGRAGVSLVKDSGGRYAFMNLVAELGEGLVGFLLGEIKKGNERFGSQEAVFAYFAILYSLRLQLLKDIASVSELVESAVNKVNSRDLIREILNEMRILRSSFVKGAGIDPLTDVFMRPFHESGCALVGMQEDSIFLEPDALAIVRSFILPLEEDKPDITDIAPSLHFLYERFLEIRGLLPGLFEDECFDAQFVRYSMLISHLELLRDKLVDGISLAASPLITNSAGRYGIPITTEGHSTLSDGGDRASH